MLGVVTIPAQKLFMNTKVVGCRKQSFLKIRKVKQSRYRPGVAQRVPES